MADNSMLIKVGLFGAAGYLAYRQGWLSFLGIGATPASGTPAAGSTSKPESPSSSGTPAKTFRPIADIRKDIEAAVLRDHPPASAGALPPTITIPGTSLVVPNPAWLAAVQNRFSPVLLSPDEWNAYATNAGAPAFPDPVSTFGSRDPIDFDTWWAKANPFMIQQGLAGLMRRYRRAA